MLRETTELFWLSGFQTVSLGHPFPTTIHRNLQSKEEGPDILWRFPFEEFPRPNSTHFRDEAGASQRRCSLSLFRGTQLVGANTRLHFLIHILLLLLPTFYYFSNY